MPTKLKKGDIVWAESFALSDRDLVKVKLLKRGETVHGWGADGWEGMLIDSDDVIKLIKGGVPYKKEEKPKVWLFDFHIVKKARQTKSPKSCKPKRKKLK
jgi:hypothetical protein